MSAVRASGACINVNGVLCMYLGAITRERMTMRALYPHKAACVRRLIHLSV